MSLPKRKPKFSFQLSIHELTNIPLPSNDCYIKWYLREPITPLKSSSIKGKTEKQHIRDYKCHWKYTAENVVKIPTNRNKELTPKMLVLMAYATPHSHHNHHHHGNAAHSGSHNPTSHVGQKLEHKRSSSVHTNDLAVIHEVGQNQKQYLGKVEINISEFASESNEPIHNRYLLQDSKINAILNISISVEAIKGVNTAEFTSPGKQGALKRRALTDIFNNSAQNSTKDDHDSTGTSNKFSSRHNESQLSPITKDYSSSKQLKNLAILNDPIVSKFYQKTFEISWDVRPGEYNARECIEDILASENGDGWAKNEDGARLIDLQNRETSNESERYVSGNFNETRPIYLKSTSLKEGEMSKLNKMKSWSVSSELLQ